MQTLRQDIADKVLESIPCKAALSYELKKHMFTIEQMIRKKSPLLTVPSAVRVIAKELGVSETEVLTELETKTM
jgi:hypothetical protein